MGDVGFEMDSIFDCFQSNPREFLRDEKWREGGKEIIIGSQILMKLRAYIKE